MGQNKGRRNVFEVVSVNGDLNRIIVIVICLVKISYERDETAIK